MGGEDVAGGAVFPCGADDGDVLLAGGDHPAVLGVDLIILLQNTAANHLIDELIGEISLAFRLGLVPHLYQVLFQTAERFLFRDAGVRYTVVVVVQQFLLLFGSKVTVTGNTIIVAVGHQVHDVFLQVVCTAANEGDFVLTNHLCQGEAQFCGGHGAGHGQEHFSSFVQEIFIGLCSIYQGCGIEMTVVMGNELRDRSLFHFFNVISAGRSQSLTSNRADYGQN